MRGKYVLQIESIIKGKCPGSIEYEAPYILNFNVQDSNLEIKVRRHYLLMMKSTDGTHFVPADRAFPLVPLAAKISARPTTNPGFDDAANEIVRVLVESVSDEAVRRSSLFLLHTIKSDAVTSVARPFIDNGDLEIQQSALACLATNQVVEAIPRIATLDRKLRKSQSAGWVIASLANYATIDAVSPLNELLLDSQSPYIQINAVRGLSNSPDRSSIPNLVKVVENPESQGSLVHFCIVLLHQLIPELGPVLGGPTDEKAAREVEIPRIRAWWADEQAGKHGPSLLRPRSSTPILPSTSHQSRAGRGPAD